MIDRELTEAEVDAVESALWAFNYAPNEPYDPECYEILDREWQDVSERLVGETLHRLLKPLLELMSETDDEGFVEFSGVRLCYSAGRPRGDQKIIFHAEVHKDGLARASFELIEGLGRTGGIIKTLSVSKLDSEERYGLPQWLASGKFFDTAYGAHKVGTARLPQFKKFVEVMSMAKPILAASPYTLPEIPEGAESQSIEFRHLPILEIDGGLAGDLSLRAARLVQVSNFEKIFDWAKDALPAVYQAEVNRGFIWNQKYLEWNDLDNRSCAIVTGDDRIAVFHQDISLSAKNCTYIASAKLVDGEVTNIEVYGFDRSAVSIYQVVEEFSTGKLEATPVASYDFLTRKGHIPGGIEETGVFASFAVRLHFDHELFVGGEMDGDERKEDSEAKTDFVENFTLETSDEDEVPTMKL